MLSQAVSRGAGGEDEDENDYDFQDDDSFDERQEMRQMLPKSLYLKS